MISIQSSLTELEKHHQLCEATRDCYVNAVKDVGQYAVELDEEVTSQFRKHMAALAGEIATGGMGVLTESRTTLRALLRDFRDKGVRYLANLRDELAGTARALEEILDSMVQTDGEHDTRLRTSLVKLREVAASTPGSPASVLIAAAADTIEQSTEQMRKQHQLTVSQFMTEIRVLHKRIDTLEAVASLDQLTRFANRAEMSERIRAAPPGQYSLLLMSLRGLLRAEVQFGSEVSDELAAAFSKRLRNSVPTGTVLGRWSTEDFMAILSLKKSEATALGKWVTENLSGAYPCLKNGRTVRPSLQITVAVVDTNASENAEHVLRRADIFFGGRP